MLDELKKYFGIVSQPTVFDDQLLKFANFVIERLPDSYKNLNWASYPDKVKQLIKLKTKILFDPPESSTELESLEEEINKIEKDI